MNEADYKRRLVSMINANPPDYAQRNEDKFAVGVLDLTVKFHDLPVVFAEGKMVTGWVFAPTPAQYQRGLRIIASGMEAVLIGWKDKRMFVSPWLPQADIRKAFTTSDRGWDYPAILRGYFKTEGNG